MLLRLNAETVLHRLMMEAVTGSVGLHFALGLHVILHENHRIRWNRQAEGGDCSFFLRAADWLWERRLKTVGRARQK